MTRPRDGFTLIELLVVLVLLSITAAAAVPMLASAPSDPDDAAASSLAALLERARDEARESGTTAELVVAPRERRYWLVGRATETRPLPLSTSQRLVAADSERVTCRFLPTGAATPCAFAVRGAHDVIVDVDQWSGVVRVHPPGEP